MSLHGKEKIWFLINRLLDEREVTEAGQPVALHPMNDLNNHYPPMDFIQLTAKLQKEHNAIKLLNNMPTDQTNGKYLIELLPDFDNYVAQLRKDPKYLEYIGEKPEPEPTQKAEPISASHARKNGIMTGKEKIQAIVEEINNKYQGLVTGNVILLHSGNLEERGLQLHEQTQVLDILANDKKAIKYTAKNEYKSRADIHPRDQVDIHEVAMDEAEASDMFDRLLEQQQYQVQVLPTFEALANELLGDAELEYQKDIYLLRLFYNRVIAVLDAVVSSSVVIEDDKLDFAYVQLTASIENILGKPSMKDWQKNVPELYETLLGHAEDIGEGWQYSRTEVLKYYAKLQKDWMLSNHTEFELDDKLAAMFEELDKLIAAHEKATRQASDNWHKNADKFAKDFRKKLVIDKEERPKQEKPDDTASAPDDEPADEQAKSTPVTVPEKVNVHPLQLNHYSDRTGKLTVSPTVEVSIAKRGKVKRKNGTKYDQCHLMSCLFKGVNTLKNGIAFSTFLGVKYDKNSKTHIRKIRNTIDEINKKVADSTTAKKLIFVHGEKIFIDKSYLKN
jgi:hypothetical protein